MKKQKSLISTILAKIIFFRWAIAFLLFVILVISKIHFSSIGVYNDLFPTVCSEEEKNSYKIFGKHRDIRSDEWMVHTPKYFAQKDNNFKRYSKRSSISEMNATLDYYAPTIGPELIGKPFNLGYILFGKEYGLSFYFCMLEILLFMTAFEMFFILTKRSVLVSFIGMLFIGFAPAMQWWLVPHITIVFVYAMALFCLGYYFLTTKKLHKKLILSIFLVSGIVGFSLSIFPSCQVVCALVDIVLFINVLKRDKEKICFDRITLALIIIISATSFGIMLEFIISSKEDFLTLLNTDYPGTRVFTGGNKRLEDVFPSLTSLYLPHKKIQFENNCEVATFVHFAPFFMMIYGKMRDRLKKDKDKDLYILKGFFITLIVEISFMSMGFSELLSKITLLKYANRMYISYGWTATLYSIYCFYIMWKKKWILKRHQAILFPILYGFLHLSLVELRLREYYSYRWLFLEVFLFLLILVSAIFRFKKFAMLSSIFIMGACGFTVNPISVGASPIFNHPISKFIEKKTKTNKDDLWIAIGGDSVNIGSFLLANGARVISTTKFYPDNLEWKLIEGDKKEYINFNRYSHHKFMLTKGRTKIALEQPDAIRIEIDANILKKLKIKYIVARKDYLIHNKDLLPPNLKKEFEQDGILVLKTNF